MKSPRKSKDIPVTQEMLFEVRDELTFKISALETSVMGEINTLSLRTDLRFQQVDWRFEKLEARMDALEVRMDDIEQRMERLEQRMENLEHRMEHLEKRMDRLESKIDLMRSEIHRIALLVEEQNSRNKFVLDGYAQIHRRQGEFESLVNEKWEDFGERLEAHLNEHYR